LDFDTQPPLHAEPSMPTPSERTYLGCICQPVQAVLRKAGVTRARATPTSLPSCQLAMVATTASQSVTCQPHTSRGRACTAWREHVPQIAGTATAAVYKPQQENGNPRTLNQGARQARAQWCTCV